MGESLRLNVHSKMLQGKKHLVFSPLKVKETYQNGMFLRWGGRTGCGEEGLSWAHCADQLGKKHPGPAPVASCPPGAPHSLGEVGQVLGHLGDEGEGAGGAVVGVLLQQVEEGGRHDGRAEKAQKQGCADEPLADVWPAAAAAFLPPRGKHLFQLPWEDTGGKRQEWAWWAGRAPAQVGAEQGPGSVFDGTLSFNPDSYELACWKAGPELKQ